MYTVCHPYHFHLSIPIILACEFNIDKHLDEIIYQYQLDINNQSMNKDHLIFAYEI